MDRKKLISLAYKREKDLTIKNPDYLNRVKHFTDNMLEEDIRESEDITTQALIKENIKVQAKIKSKQEGIIAGIEEAEYFLNKHNISVKKEKNDGSRVKKGDTVLILEGKIKGILKTERTVLNLLQRMSGIASITNKLAEKTENILITATRKTHWGLLDNKAAAVGGGGTHRLGLYESILIKENHLEPIKKEDDIDYIKIALKRAWEKKDKAVFIEIEVKNKAEAIIAAETFKELNKDKKKPCIIMLDNFSPQEIKKTIKEIKELELYDSILIEASGGINPANIEEYDNSGADAASLGLLTHSPKALDLSLLIE